MSLFWADGEPPPEFLDPPYPPLPLKFYYDPLGKIVFYDPGLGTFYAPTYELIDFQSYINHTFYRIKSCTKRILHAHIVISIAAFY